MQDIYFNCFKSFFRYFFMLPLNAESIYFQDKHRGFSNLLSLKYV